MRRAILIAVFAMYAVPVFAQEAPPTTIPQMWTAWCARCHGNAGDGKVENSPVPLKPRDFTACKSATGEADPDWALAIAKGGPAVGLSPLMPGFDGALKPDQIQAFVDYLRKFCTEPGWPDGNLNLPRPMFTEKAFPEDEFVITPVASHVKGEPTEWSTEATLEKRLGKRAQLELTQPFNSADVSGQPRDTGIGDFEIGMKYVLTPNVHNNLVTAGIDVTTPTGNSAKGLGAGEAGFEPYIATATAFGTTYFQTQFKFELPKDGPWANKVTVYRMALNHDLSSSPEAWTLGVELTGENTDVAITPQVRKGLTPTGAIAGALGVSLPVNHRDEQGVKWVGFILWEFMEKPYWRR